MKTLSVRAEFAYYIAAGIKKIEYRSRNCRYRGTILIHVSGKGLDLLPPFDDNEELSPTFKETWSVWNDEAENFIFSGDERFFRQNQDGHILLNPEAPDYVLFSWGWNRTLRDEEGFPSQAIIGQVDIVDTVHCEDEGFWEWHLTNPVLYRDPIPGVKGKLGLWEWSFPDMINPVPWSAKPTISENNTHQTNP